jgi:hypothetical protein
MPPTPGQTEERLAADFRYRRFDDRLHELCDDGVYGCGPSVACYRNTVVAVHHDHRLGHVWLLIRTSRCA